MGFLERIVKRAHNAAAQKAPYPVLVKQRVEIQERRHAALLRYVAAAGQANFATMEKYRKDVSDQEEMMAVIDNRLEREFGETTLRDIDPMKEWHFQRRCARCNREYLRMIEKCIVCSTPLPRFPEQ